MTHNISQEISPNLREECQSNNDPHPLPVPRSGKQASVANVGSHCSIEINSGLDFIEFEVNKGIVTINLSKFSRIIFRNDLLVTISVPVSKNTSCFLISTLTNEPPG